VRAREGKKSAASLVAGDLEIREDGVACPIVAIERAAASGARAASSGGAVSGRSDGSVAAGDAAARPWRIAIYIDLQMAGVSSVRQAAWELGGQAEALARLGEVEVALADERVERVFGPSGDAEEIRKFLRKRVADQFGQRRLVRLRQELLEQSNARIGLVQRRSGSAVSGGQVGLVRAFGFEEARLLESRRQMLERYFAERSVPDWPQAAFVVTGGFDLEPGEFYLPLVERGGGEDPDVQRLRADFSRVSQGPAVEAVARQLAALGWTVFPVLAYDQEAMLAGSASQDGSDKWRAMFGGPGAAAPPLSLIAHPDEPWRSVAGATGGELLADLRRLDDAVAGLESRWLVTYQVAHRRDGALHRLEILPRRAGLEVEGPRWIAAGTPEALAAARARSLLDGETSAGDLPVRAVVVAEPAGAEGQSAGRVEATVEFAPLGAARATLGATALRFTIAVPRPDGTVMVIHEVESAADLRARAGWIFDARLVAPRGTAKVGVVVEELTTGAWGGAVADWRAAG
jgi:hypothetical protein